MDKAETVYIMQHKYISAGRRSSLKDLNLNKKVKTIKCISQLLAMNITILFALKNMKATNKLSMWTKLFL
jgi:hypothetical protein